MKIRIKYPHLTLLILSYLVLFLVIKIIDLNEIKSFILSLGYLAPLITGIFYAYGFTAAPATALFALFDGTHNIIISGLLGGLGALMGDFLFFRFVKKSMKQEINLIAKSKLVKICTSFIPHKIKKSLSIILGSIIIASPLPDEIGITILADMADVSSKKFLTISYCLNTLGIMLILAL